VPRRLPLLAALLTAVATVALVAGCGFVNAGRNGDIKPDGFVLRGYVSVLAGAADSACTPAGPVSDITAGTAVRVTDGAGAAMGSAVLGAGVRDGSDCNYPFQVPAVPRRDDRYLISVGSRQPVSFPAGPLRQDKPAVIKISA
jgi:hypothetical protein